MTEAGWSWRWIWIGVAAFTAVLVGCQSGDESGLSTRAPVPSGEPVYNTVGRLMPDDAAPLDQQHYRFLVIEPSTLDANIAIYQAQSGLFPFEGLGRLNHDFELVPAAAERWESNDAGDVWTFHLRQDARWSDGRPVTAHDFEYTFKRAIDPGSANVYAFFYYPIKGAKAFNQGTTKDRSSVGVKAVDDHTLVIETEGPCPYLPQLTAFTGSGAVPSWQVEKYGPKWTEPENCVTNSSFMLESWDHGRQMEFVLNPHYSGPFKAYLERVTAMFIGAESDAGHLPYEEDEVDYQVVTSREVPALRGNPELRDELHVYSTFRTRFLIFDDQNKPYNDLRVRQAISHAIDRDVLANVVMQGTASPAYSMLPPGFPGDAGNTLDHIQRYDPMRDIPMAAGFRGRNWFCVELK